MNCLLAVLVFFPPPGCLLNKKYAAAGHRSLRTEYRFVLLKSFTFRKKTTTGPL